MAGKKSSHRVLGSPLTIPVTRGHRSQMPLQFRQVTPQRQDVLFHHGDTEGSLIADWRLRISDLEFRNSFSMRTIRDPQSEIRNSKGISVSSVSVVNKALEFFLSWASGLQSLQAWPRILFSFEKVRS